MLDVSSPTIPIDIGIAQGSFHGPLMFIIYVKNIIKCSIEINFLIYADDTTLYVSGLILVNAYLCIMNHCLSHVYR